MPKITIDNQNYDLGSLNDDAKAQLASLQFVDSELARLTAQTKKDTHFNWLGKVKRLKLIKPMARRRCSAFCQNESWLPCLKPL